MAELGLPERYWNAEGIERGGSRFFAVLGRPHGAVDAYTKLAALRDLASANRSLLGKAHTLALDTITRDLARSMEQIGVLAAEAAETAAKRTLEATRKRPQGPGRGGIHLEDLITARAIQQFPPLAEVGIGEIETLSKHPGWRVQELGSTHLVEMTHRLNVYGAFQPGDAAPNIAEFRVHPIFRTGEGLRLLVRNEVTPRGYLRTGTVVAGIKRKQRLDRLDVRLASEIRAIREGTHSRIRAARRVVGSGAGFRGL
jgi:hypothetical protein